MKLDRFTVGKRYGKAIYQAAAEKGQLEEVREELLVLEQVYTDIPDLGEILSDVRLEPNEKAPIVEKLAACFSEMVQNFISVVYDYNRLDSVPLMIEEFQRLYNEERGIVYGTVTTAVPLSPELHSKLEAQYAAYLDAKAVYLTSKVDPALIGGAIVEANHKIVDGSIRTQIQEVSKALTN